MIKEKRNWAQCRKCEDIIISEHRHDFISCRCEAIFIDGGDAYWRGGGDLDSIIMLDEYGHPMKEE